MAPQTPSLPVPKRNVAILHVAWSPDGKRISYTEADLGEPPKFDPSKFAVYIVDADGKNRVRIPGQAIGGEFTHDGKGLIHVSMREKARQLYRYDFGTKESKAITDPAILAMAPAVNPVDGTIAFNSNKEGDDLQIYTMRPDGSGIKKITAVKGKAFTPSWSFDGKQIAYYREIGDNKDQVHVMNADGTGDRRISKADQHNFYPAFLPSGDLSYTNPPEPTAQRVVIVSPDGTEKSVWPYPSFMIRWSKDGRAAFVAGPQMKHSVFVSNADGSNPVCVSEG